MSFLLGNEYRPEESGVDMSSPVNPVAPPLSMCNIKKYMQDNQGEHSLLSGDGSDTFWVCEMLSGIPSCTLFGA